MSVNTMIEGAVAGRVKKSNELLETQNGLLAQVLAELRQLNRQIAWQNSNWRGGEDGKVHSPRVLR